MLNYQEELQAGLRERYRDKQILILGFGREGKTTYHFLRRLLPEQTMTLMDEREIDLGDEIFRLPTGGRDEKIRLLWGENYLQDLNCYDLIFKTPGLPGFRLQGVERAKITSQTNEFVFHVGERVIGITGTKGKSTTSSLVYEGLKAMGKDVLLVGNIGRPALELLLEDEPERYYVYEMSSHQTQFLRYSPRVAVVLNLFEEHLDNYVDYEEYIRAKLNIGKALFTGRCPGKSLFLYGCDNAKLKEYSELWQKCRHQAFGHMENSGGDDGVFIKGKEIIFIESESAGKEGLDEIPEKLPRESVMAESSIAIKERISGQRERVLGTTDFPRKLLGEHNLGNALVAFAVVRELFGLHQETVAILYRVISEFAGLEHRLEYVGEFSGIRFYNDSISTIPAAAMEAIHSIEKLQTLIVGGFDRGIHYQQFIEDLNEHPELKIICLPNTGHKLFPGLTHAGKYLAADMSEAVKTAYAVTDKGNACVLSPAAASYTFYTNFEERGADFKEKVRENYEK